MYGTLADLKTALGITDNTRDTVLTTELQVASELIDNLCGRGLNAFNPASASATTRVVRTGNTTFEGDLIVPGIGDVTGLLVEAGGPVSYATVPATGYDPGPDNAIVNGQPITLLRNLTTAWSAYPYVRVTARFGWPGGATPASVTKAALLLANRMYRRKDSPEGFIGSPDWGGIRVSRTDHDVMALLSSYMLPGFA